MIPFDEFQELPNLVGFGFSFDLLQVDQLIYVCMYENMMAATNASQAESKCFHQSNHIVKGYVFSTRYDCLQQFARLHFTHCKRTIGMGQRWSNTILVIMS